MSSPPVATETRTAAPPPLSSSPPGQDEHPASVSLDASESSLLSTAAAKSLSPSSQHREKNLLKADGPTMYFTEEKKSEKNEDIMLVTPPPPETMAANKNKSRKNSLNATIASSSSPSVQVSPEAAAVATPGGAPLAEEVVAPTDATANNEKSITSVVETIATPPSVTPPTKQAATAGTTPAGHSSEGGGGIETQRIVSSLDRAAQAQVATALSADVEDSKTPERREHHYEQEGEQQEQEGDDDYDSSDDGSYFADPNILPSPKSERRYSWSSQNSVSETAPAATPHGGRGGGEGGTMSHNSNNNNNNLGRESDASLSLSDDSDDDRQHHHHRRHHHARHTDPHLYEPPPPRIGGQTPEVFPQRITRIHSVRSLATSDSSQNSDDDDDDEDDPIVQDELRNVAMERGGGYDSQMSSIPSGRLSPLQQLPFSPMSQHNMPQASPPPIMQQGGYPYPSSSDFPHPQPQVVTQQQQLQYQQQHQVVPPWMGDGSPSDGPLDGGNNSNYPTTLQSAGSGWSDCTFNYSQDEDNNNTPHAFQQQPTPSHAFEQQNWQLAITNEATSGGATLRSAITGSDNTGGSGRGTIQQRDRGKPPPLAAVDGEQQGGRGVAEDGIGPTDHTGKISSKKNDDGDKGEPNNSDHVDGEGNFKVYWQRWIMLLYMSALNLLSDWTCYSVAPIALLTQEAFGKINAEQLVVVFLGANTISTACEPIILSRLGLRRTVLFGALLLMIGSIIKSGGMPPIINAELKKGKGEWRVYLGFFLVGLSQPLYQCTPALLSASWFPERERTMATGVALNANQLGIGFAFIFGTLLVANSDDIPSYFGLLSIISTITFFGALLQFDDAPPTPPSDTARVIRGTLKVDIPSVTSILQSIGYRGQGGNPPPVNPPLNMAPDSTASKSKSKSKSRRSKEKKSRSAASSSSSGIARRRNPNPTPGGVPQPGTGASGFDSSYRGVGPSPSPARYGRVSERYPAPSPMLPGAVAGSTQSLDPSESGQDSEAPDPDAPELPYDQPGIYPSLYPTGMLPPGGYAMPPGLWYGPDGGGGGAPPQYPPYGYPYPGVPPGPPPQGMVPPGYPPPPYWDPRFQQYPPYAMKPFQQVQPGQHKQQLPYYYPPQGMPPQMMMNQYYSYQHGQPGHPDAYDIPRGPYSDAHAMLPPTSLIDEGAEPVLTISAHHLDINIRDDQVFLSTKACLSRPGFIHSLVSFTVSGIVINTLSTFMDYLVRLNGAGREMTGIVGGSFQFVIMCSSLIIGKLTDRSRAYYSVTIAMLVLGAFGLAQCGVSLNADKGNQLRVSLIIVAILVGPLQPVSTELGVEVAYPLSENTVLVIQQLFSNLLSALFIPCFKAMKNIGINKSDEAAEQPEYTFSFYLLIVLHAAATVWFATFNGRYLRYEHELIKKEQQENRRNHQQQQQQQQQQAAWGQYEPANDTAPLIANEHPLV